MQGVGFSHQQPAAATQCRVTPQQQCSPVLASALKPSFTLLEFKVYAGSTVVVVLWCSGAVCSGAVQWWVSERGKCSCISGALPVATV